MVPWWGWALIAFGGAWTLILLILIIALLVIIRNED